MASELTPIVRDYEHLTPLMISILMVSNLRLSCLFPSEADLWVHESLSGEDFAF